MHMQSISFRGKLKTYVYGYNSGFEQVNELHGVQDLGWRTINAVQFMYIPLDASVMDIDGRVCDVFIPWPLITGVFPIDAVALAARGRLRPSSWCNRPDRSKSSMIASRRS